MGGINIQSIALGKKHSRNSTDKGGLTSQVGKDLGDLLVSSAHLTFQVPSWVSLWLTALSLCSSVAHVVCGVTLSGEVIWTRKLVGVYLWSLQVYSATSCNLPHYFSYLYCAARDTQERIPGRPLLMSFSFVLLRHDCHLLFIVFCICNPKLDNHVMLDL